MVEQSLLGPVRLAGAGDPGLLPRRAAAAGRAHHFEHHLRLSSATQADQPAAAGRAGPDGDRQGRGREPAGRGRRRRRTGRAENVSVAGCPGIDAIVAVAGGRRDVGCRCSRDRRANGIAGRRTGRTGRLRQPCACDARCSTPASTAARSAGHAADQRRASSAALAALALDSGGSRTGKQALSDGLPAGHDDRRLVRHDCQRRTAARWSRRQQCPRRQPPATPAAQRPGRPTTAATRRARQRGSMQNVKLHATATGATPRPAGRRIDQRRGRAAAGPGAAGNRLLEPGDRHRQGRQGHRHLHRARAVHRLEAAGQGHHHRDPGRRGDRRCWWSRRTSSAS